MEVLAKQNIAQVEQKPAQDYGSVAMGREPIFQIWFLYVAPHFWIGIAAPYSRSRLRLAFRVAPALQTPPRDDALALLLTLGSANTWYEDFHLTSYVPCLAHT